MKKIYYRLKTIAIVLALPLALATSGCGDSNDDTGAEATADQAAVTSSDLLGTWKMVSFSYESEFSTGEVSGKISAEGVDLDNVLLIFKPDGTTQGSGSFNVNMSTTIGGHTTTKKLKGNSPVNNGTWKRNGNTLTIGSPGHPTSGSQHLTITKLDSNGLEINGDLPNPAGGGNTIKLKVEYNRVNQNN